MNKASQTHKLSRWRRAVRIAEQCLAIIGAMFLIYHACFRLEHVTTSSMAPTLNGQENGGVSDWVLIEKPSYWLRAPHRWEVASVRLSDGTLAAKRIVGLPGEQVSLQSGQICINGNVQAFPTLISSLRYVPTGTVRKGQTYSCGLHAYFFLGDSWDSMDSRDEGGIDASNIHGRAFLRVWPLTRFGLINP